jgi:hypothetical protein
MSQAITTSPVQTAAPPPGPPQVQRQTAMQWAKKRLLEPVASLRVTVVLFSLSLFLVFVGTLAQAETGNLTVINQYFRSWGIVLIPFQVFVKLGQVFFGLPADLKVAGAFPFPGGWLLGALLLCNLLAAHAVRFRTGWKRSGILLIHAGLVVMMLSEFVTGVYAVEGYMPIADGETTNVVENHRALELAVIDRSDPKTDNVVVIPESALRKGGTIRHELLPFDVTVVRYMVNSLPRKALKGEKHLAADGVAKEKDIIMDERPEVSGVDMDSGVDLASAYVTFKKKGTDDPLGTYLVSVWFNSNSMRRTLPDLYQQVEADGKVYDIMLRSQRSYRPYSLQLLEFRHDRFVGMDKAKNFSSVVRLVDPAENEKREVKIWMNHPLRYAGETFYQAQFLPGDRGTILQVVRNPGWLMPYISCVMVALGMLIHFGLHLAGFLRKRAAL